MKEYVFVEFLFRVDEATEGLAILKELGEDFIFIKNETEWDSEDAGQFDLYQRCSGKINSMTASVLKLKYPEFAEKMRISYISDELKDKYRR